MSWRGGAVASRNDPRRGKARAAAPSNPPIPGYRVFRGRTLLHARHLGRPANARAEHRPYHVVARTLQELVEAVNGGR